MGEAKKIVESIDVNKVIFNVGSYNYLEKDLIKALKRKNIKYYKNIENIYIGNTPIYFLNTGVYNNENDNSNVVYFIVNNYKFLLMGDAGEEKEKDILNEYSIEDIDFLKVGHHGSDTSSSKGFIVPAYRSRACRRRASWCLPAPWCATPVRCPATEFRVSP